jgi:DNA polymerase III subunit epsilon
MLHKMERRLADLHILTLDCQATGANPDKGHLLEIGWAVGRATAEADSDQVRSHLIRQPLQPSIPPMVQRITGISEDALIAAVSAETAWRSLTRAARSTAARNQQALCPAVIHFARFEDPFLRQLHAAHDPQTPFPLQLICTHAIAARLLPELPRRGIRALAGYFGHPMPQLRRCADHARATLVIWKALVDLLRNRSQIETLEQLTRWLADVPVPTRTPRAYPMDPAVRRHLPDAPGIYRMLRDNAGILYIGKAKSLKSRVNSYFRIRAPHAEHILEMLSQARDIDFSSTGSALEAALLESDEIKRHLPPYNKALRPGRRSLVFLTRDLKKRSSLSDKHYCIGPLPDDRLIDALQAFASWISSGMRLRKDDPSNAGHLLLGLAEAYAPDIHCLQEGLDLFRSGCWSQLQHRSALRIVTALGAQLQRRQLEAAATAQTEAESQEDEEKRAGLEEVAGQPVWTPETVATALEHMLIRAAHLIRRARWYCLLSESCLAWTPAGKPEGPGNLLIIQGGRIRKRQILHAGQYVPPPPGHGRSWCDRRKAFDLAAYDRLRVLTTELRRLLCDDRRVELRIGPNKGLNKCALKKALQWV